jgi:acyl dehydratase
VGAPLYYEDLEIGRAHGSDELTVSREEVLEFAARYDPQPFHLSESAAEASVFGGLVASGWHTAALTMRLRVTGDLQLAGGWVGLGVESMRWPKPVRPGDRLRAEMTVIEKRESRSNPTRGVIRVRTATFNQNGELVFETITAQIVERRERG